MGPLLVTGHRKNGCVPHYSTLPYWWNRRVRRMSEGAESLVAVDDQANKVHTKLWPRVSHSCWHFAHSSLETDPLSS